MELQGFLFKTYQGVIDNQITLFFTSLLLILFFITIILYSSSNTHRSQNLIRVCPSLLIQIGILGTFVGIFMGLFEFDVRNIDASIPPLLEGLKIAFTTSIIGMFLALLLRSIIHILPKSISNEGVTATDIYHVLANIRSSISGDEETSMVSQIQKLRISTTDHLTNLKNYFAKFASSMAENNTNALIEALEKVMKDFNTKINEQFGDNFKRLNEAVAALLVWQDKYKEHVEKLTDQFQKTLTGIDQAKESLSIISQQMSVIPQTVMGLKELIETVQTQTNNLTRHLEIFKDLRQQATDAFPLIEKRILGMTENFSNAVTNSVSTIEETVKEQSKDFTEIAITLRNIFEGAIKESNENLTKQMEALDKSMQDEIKRVVEVMGSNLASLSNKFVEDYSPLTERLKAVVRLSESVSRENGNVLA